MTTIVMAYFFLWDFLYHKAMNEDRFEQLKSSKEKEAQKFYEVYHVEFDKGTNPVYYPVYPYFCSNEEVEKKTVKLSNSTTPMACY